jgi:hypothetical protein
MLGHKVSRKVYKNTKTLDFNEFFVKQFPNLAFSDQQSAFSIENQADG